MKKLLSSNYYYIAGLVLLSSFFVSGSAQAERQIANYQKFTAFLNDEQSCSENMSVVVRHPLPVAFTDQRTQLRRLLGGVKSVITSECSKVNKLMVIGESAGKPVYSGIISSAAEWVLVDTRDLVEDKVVESPQQQSGKTIRQSVAEIPKGKFNTVTSDKPFFPNDFKNAYELLGDESFVFGLAFTGVRDWHFFVTKMQGYKAAYESEHFNNIVFIKHKGEPLKDKDWNEYYRLFLVQATSRITGITYYVFLKDTDGGPNEVRDYINDRNTFTMYRIIRESFTNNIDKIDLDNLPGIFHERRNPTGHDHTRLNTIRDQTLEIEFKGKKYRNGISTFVVDKSEKDVLAYLLKELPKEKIAANKKREYGEGISTAFHHFLLSRCNKLTALSTRGAGLSALTLRLEDDWCTTSNLGTKLSFRLRTISDLNCSETGNDIHQCSFSYKLACEMESAFSNEPVNRNFVCNAITSVWHPAKGTFKQIQDGTFETIEVDIGQSQSATTQDYKYKPIEIELGPALEWVK